MTAVDVPTFRSIFRGRYDDWAQQNDEGGYFRAQRPLQNTDIEEHLAGDRTVGVYLIDPADNTCWHTVLDVDSLEKEPRQKVAKAFKDLGLAAYVILEFSGMKGYHFWLCYSEPVPAANARALGKIIGDRAGITGLEVFPKQDTIEGDGFGNLVKLPLGIHRKSGKRSTIQHPVDWQTVGKITPAQLDKILTVNKLPEPARARSEAGASTQTALPCIQRMLEGVGEGCRDNVTYQLILHLRRTLDQDSASAALLEWDTRNKPPLGESVIHQKVRSLWKSPAKGFGCDKDWMQQFCNAAVCPVHAKAREREIPTINGVIKQQKGLLEEACPKYGWLWEYLEYASASTDAPEVFHLFGGLSALSAVVGRKVYLPFGDGAVYPNTWIVLIAASSLFHKTTALYIPARLLRIINDDLLLPNEFSPEVLVANMEAQPTGLLLWSEMKNALGMMERSYMAGTREMLTDLYDCPDVYIRKLRERTYRIQSPAISILAATTVDWLVESIKANDISGGFTARFVFVPAMAKSREIALPEPTNIHQRNQMAVRLHRCAEVEGMVDFSGVRKLYEEWYYPHIAELAESPFREQLSGFYSRLAVYTLKFAILLEVSKTNDILVQEETLREAFAITDYLKASIRHLIEHEFHATREAAEIEKLFKIIDARPGIERRDLLRYSHMAVRTFQPLVDTLLQAGRIQMKGKEFRVVR